MTKVYKYRLLKDLPEYPKDWERGKVKRYDNYLAGAWVVYDGGNGSKVDHYSEYTAALTDYDKLTWELTI